MRSSSPGLTVLTYSGFSRVRTSGSAYSNSQSGVSTMWASASWIVPASAYGMTKACHGYVGRMEFDDAAALDTSQVQDRRGIPGGGLAIGGGAGVIGLVLALLFGFNPLSGGSSGPSAGTAGTQAQLAQECRTGADANAKEDCRIVGVINSVQAFWTTTLGGSGRSYTPAETVFFTDATQTGCGTATSDVGPFYCPSDKHVYIDLGFYRDLQSRFGAKGGPFAQAYVLAHEYGHHVQDLLGTMSRARQGVTGPQS